MQDEINLLLKEVGLSPSQTSVYMSLLQESKNVKDLTIELGLGRSTIVEALLYLEKVGLIYSNHQKDSNRKHYHSNGINSLNLLIEKKISNLNFVQDQLEESKQKIGKMLKVFGGNLSAFDSRTQLFIGKKEIANLYRSTVSIEKIYSICRLDDYYTLFPGGLSIQSQANRLKKTRVFRDLIIKGPSVEGLIKNKENIDYTNYSFKIIEDSPLLKESSFSDIMINNSFTIFSNFKGSSPYSIKLNSSEISKFLIYFHNIVWENVG
jgi:predicted transcriptional regulator